MLIKKNNQSLLLMKSFPQAKEQPAQRNLQKRQLVLCGILWGTIPEPNFPVVPCAGAQGTKQIGVLGVRCLLFVQFTHLVFTLALCKHGYSTRVMK